MAQDQGRELGWNDPIEHDGSDWTLLPAGEYPFRVIGFERKRYQPKPGSKLPPCNEARLTLDIGDADNSTTVQHSLYLHTRTEGLLCAFFRAVGARKHGERVAMDWARVVGATGRCKLGVRDWTGQDGQARQSNQVEKFLDPADAAGGEGEGAKADCDLPF